MSGSVASHGLPTSNRIGSDRILETTGLADIRYREWRIMRDWLEGNPDVTQCLCGPCADSVDGYSGFGDEARNRTCPTLGTLGIGNFGQNI